MKLWTTAWALAALQAFALTAYADLPKADAKGLSDPPGLKRYTGSVLIYRHDAAYDELKLPRATIQLDDNNRFVVPQSLARGGQRTALQYIAPAGRSPLEVLRGYQQDLKGAGFDTVYECAGEACGGSDIFSFGLPKYLLPRAWEGAATNGSPTACSAGSTFADLRYALLDNKATGTSIGVATWVPQIGGAYCDEKAYSARTTAAVIRVEAKAREQNMETISASEMNQSLQANGKVAIYGIYFDTNKADVKAESKPSLDQIGALLKQQPALKLHVVGHTDNVGNLPANLELSRRRADAVAALLAKDYGIARDRLTANGVANLAPVASNGSDAGRAKNRRVELVLQ
jgi:outer membrane protein OmpA-like peptidoglycan-associated protein